MKSLMCTNCGGNMVIDASSMTASCPYCGRKFLLDHEDTDYFHEFYKQMHQFFSATESERERKIKAHEFWEHALDETFETIDGKHIEIKYMHKYTESNADVYVARRNIIFHFNGNKSYLVENYRHIVSFLDYPSADTRQLSDFFPKVVGGYKLVDGSNILVISKDEDEYPLHLFGTLPGRHVAWVISRMENLCCVLEYNGIVHPYINIDSLYINPYTHQACLYGNWWNAGRKNARTFDSGCILNMSENLNCIRIVAAKLLGFNSVADVNVTDDIPLPLVKFVKSTPRKNAYEDFAYWDEMLIKSYGERKFMNLNTDDEKIYNSREN